MSDDPRLAPLFNRIAAFARGLDELGYTPSDQVKALGGYLAVILMQMEPAEREIALSVQLLGLAEMFVGRDFKRQMVEVVAANIRRLH